MRPRLPAAHRVGNPEGHAALEHITPHRQLRVLLAQPRQLRALALAQLPVPALPAAPVSIDPVSQGPRVHPQIPGHLRDRLARLADKPHRALPEVLIELPACLSHRRTSLSEDLSTLGGETQADPTIPAAAKNSA